MYGMEYSPYAGALCFGFFAGFALVASFWRQCVVFFATFLRRFQIACSRQSRVVLIPPASPATLSSMRLMYALSLCLVGV